MSEAAHKREWTDYIAGVAIWTALGWLVASAANGAVVARKLVDADFRGSFYWLSYGTLRAVHVNGMVFGFAVTASMAVVISILPRLTGARLKGAIAMAAIVLMWNAAVALDIAAVSLGFNQGVELGEAPRPVDALMILVLAAFAIVVIYNAATREKREVHPALRFILAACVWTPMMLAVGNFVAPIMGNGVDGMALMAFYKNGLLDLVLPAYGFAFAYYLVGSEIGESSEKVASSSLGFWLFAFIYPFGGVGDYVFTAVPAWAACLALAFRAAMIVPTLLISRDLYLVAGWRGIGENSVVKVVAVAMLVLLGFQAADAMYSIPALHANVQFTDWHPAHTHALVFGAFAIVALAAMAKCWTEIVGAHKVSHMTAPIVVTIAVLAVVMTLVLGSAGVAQGAMWRAKAALFEESVRAVETYRNIAAACAVALTASLALYVFSIIPRNRHGGGK